MTLVWIIHVCGVTSAPESRDKHLRQSDLKLIPVVFVSMTVCGCVFLCQRPVVEKKAAAESCGTVWSSDTQSSRFTSSHSSHTQKAKALDAHLPSLKRRRLSEYGDEGSV